MKKRICKNWLIILLAILIILMVIIFRDSIKNNVFPIDTSIIKFINGIHSDNMTALMKIITNFGSYYAIIIVTVILYFITNHKQSYLISLDVLVCFLFNYSLKLIVQKPRFLTSLIVESGYSFPSGHAMVSLSFYGLLIYLCYKNVKGKYKWILILLLSLLVLLIGFSRLYLGVHYLTDVVAGYIISFVYLIIFIKLCVNKE